MRRNDTTELADELAMYNIKAIAYHAGLLPAQREQAQNDSSTTGWTWCVPR